MFYFVNFAYNNTVPSFRIEEVIDRIRSMPHFLVGDSAFVFNDELTEKGLYNYLIEPLSNSDLENTICQIYNKPASYKSFPPELEEWMKEMDGRR
ncbi:hypothetical protein WQ57_09655 [Mesobacillus campisalis]|uniref:Uncharacterized protein n=1 Tax=Mesobacillus campisalis TaxID=1408103 RepID=A0A0M2SYN4_9BACI|nr:hypothetical protein [Mesobacillus campisalis]KKK38082.1 hypothetical protein WQ57_09655 [Mesobacillus campisalis]